MDKPALAEHLKLTINQEQVRIFEYTLGTLGIGGLIFGPTKQLYPHAEKSDIFKRIRVYLSTDLNSSHCGIITIA